MYFDEYVISKTCKERNISEASLYSYKEKALKENKDLVSVLRESGYLPEKYYYETLSEFSGYVFGFYNIFNIDNDLIKDLNRTFLVEKRILPLSRRENKILVLIDNLKSLTEVDNLKYFFDEDFEIELVAKSNLDMLINSITSKEKRLEANEELENETKKEFKKSLDLDRHSLEDYLNVPTIVFANNLLLEAVSSNASDIHIEPAQHEVRIRFRIDGSLQYHTSVELSLYPALLARYKIMANLDISERRIPQDGKISKEIMGRNYDFRISTLPNLYGEKIVIRIYSEITETLTIDSIANNAEELAKIKHMIEAPHGILLLTGPTGSGKTTSLYAFIKELNKEEINIQTVEDPVENQIDGVNQLQVNPKSGLTFGKALRSILRQDPNVIMVGEIRDEETAHIAVQAAITGHLVLSTIHTNDAATVITRLIDMGVEPYLALDSMIGAISQRLVRKLCPHCKKEHELNEVEAELLHLPVKTKVYKPCGCNHCNQTGYIGRTAVFEILAFTQKVRDQLDSRNLSSDAVFKAARNEGFNTIGEACAKLVKDGVTSVDEYIKLINLNETD